MSLREQLQSTLGSAYTLERELGGGGMSRVFVAEERSLGRKVVVKVLPPEIAAGVSADRFKREIQLAARLQHPHIVPLLSSGEMDGVPFYTMPFVEGESLRARLARSGALAIGEVVGILRDVAKALAYAHERGIVHRDIKPDNVLLSGGSATVADFGIAKAIDAARSGADRQETLTSIGSSIGTPAYMAPEQAAADPATNHRADIYAFGCMAYELLAGRPPFAGMTPQRLLAAQMSDAPDPIQTHRPDVPPEIAQLVMRCLEKEPEARPQSARDLVQVLDSATSAGGHEAMPAILLGGKGMMRRALLAYAAAFVFVAVLAKAAIVAIGLPDWVYPGALVVMALGLPVILFTAYVHRVTRTLVTQTPTYTPGGSRASGGTMATFAMKASPHVSWRRTWLGGVFAVGAFVSMVAAYMVLRAAGVGPFGSLLASGALQQNERLLVADFGGTADSTIGMAVTEAFRTALGQSRSVSLMQPTDVRGVLRRMRRPEDTRVDFAVAREIASREGIRAVVNGEITELGGRYSLSVWLASPQTGERIASFRETAADEAELLPAIDKLTRDMRAKIGESLRQVQTTLPLERVTTPSLEALKKYVQGSRIMSYEGDFTRGATLLEQAISLDTGFAMAYRRLAVEYSNRSQPARAMELLQKAFDHSDRLSDAERYLVLGSYYQRGPQQDLVKSTQAYEALIELQPDHVTPLNNVAINYRWQRDWPRAEASLRRVIALPSPPAVAFNQLIWTLWNQGKHDEAWAVMATYDSLYPTNFNRLGRRVEMLFALRQFDSVQSVSRALLRERPNDPQIRAPVTLFSMNVALAQGRLRDGLRLSEELSVLSAQRGDPQAALEREIRRAQVRLLIQGDHAGAAAIVDRALERTPLEQLPEAVRPYLDLGLLYGAVGRADRVRMIMASFESAKRTVTSTEDPVTRSALRGALALAEQRPADAVRAFQEADIGDCPACALPDIAFAFDLAAQPDSAVATFERYFAANDMYRHGVDRFHLASAHKRAGEIYEARGDRQKALTHYLQFVDLWKNADAELQPRVSDVRARIARLRDTEGAR